MLSRILYNYVVTYFDETKESRSIVSITRRFRICYSEAQFYIKKMLEQGLIVEKLSHGVNKFYKFI